MTVNFEKHRFWYGYLSERWVGLKEEPGTRHTVNCRRSKMINGLELWVLFKTEEGPRGSTSRREFTVRTPPMARSVVLLLHITTLPSPPLFSCLFKLILLYDSRHYYFHLGPVNWVQHSRLDPENFYHS